MHTMPFLKDIAQRLHSLGQVPDRCRGDFFTCLFGEAGV